MRYIIYEVIHIPLKAGHLAALGSLMAPVSYDLNLHADYCSPVIFSCI